ncbi:MAG: glycosyltransferase, partial [Gammaproteobacteria bacterium]|nr:glycosyltransferase [Gammaproteobacteria bacterium]
RRVISNFMLARAWNPARWPWLVSRLIGNLSTQGMVETLRRIQNRGDETTAEPQQSINTELPNTELPSVEAEAAKTSNVASLDEGTGDVETTGMKATNVESENPENRDSDNTALETIVSVPVGESNAPSAFPNTAQPRVSIIIPVFNQWAYTAACLTSLLEIKGKYDFELIIVDDQSSDETAHHLSRIEGLTHLRNKKNLGFVGGCNRGARHARGEYIVFLNNDTQVLQGWLDELIDTFDREPLAGLVGSRLVYPDGSLQE